MKKFLIVLLLLLIVAAVFLVPLPSGTLDDGGTRVYMSLTYKLVVWNRLDDNGDGVYRETKFYFGENRKKSIDELWALESEQIMHTVRATVVEINGDLVSIEPLEGEWERESYDRIMIDARELDKISFEVGTVLEVTYKGAIMETSPAQINAIFWELANDLRHLRFEGEWLDKTTAEQYDSNIFSDIVIKRIYADCFFATPVIPMPYEIKLNGSLSEDFCVGDQVICTYENVYYDEKANRVEVDFLSVEPSDWEPEPGVAYKPVIYLYPEEQTEVSVTLTLDGTLSCTYPTYRDGWTVTASPDGTLTDADGQTYNYLYWEGETFAQYDFSEGFCVRGEDTAAFLEDALTQLGLTRREANEFIVFWLPLMQNNPYNVISFQSECYTDAAALEVTPSPDTLIRVFMAWQASDVAVQLPEQALQSPERVGFTVVEWGGTEVK